METAPLFKFAETGSQIHIVMDSRMENVDKAANLTREFLYNFNLGSICFSTCLVLREALTNAVRHAHKYDISKKIFYTVAAGQNEVTIKIEDQGDGFNWRKALESEYNDHSQHGRGFKIMAAYFNTVEFNEKGTIIFLKKKF
jgi:serine/threonine-protein kinase RsbW